MAIEPISIISVPIDNGSNATTSISLDISGTLMFPGYIVFVFLQQRGTGTWTNTISGGQTWTLLNVGTATNKRLFVATASFNGTWESSNIQFTCTAGTNTSAVMFILKPSPGHTISPIYDYFQTGTATSASVTIPVFPTVFEKTITIASWYTADDNTWGTLTGEGWTKSGMLPQYRNVAGNDTSMTFAYYAKDSGFELPFVSQTQLTLGADQTLWSYFEFSETAPETYNESITLGSTHNLSTSGFRTVVENMTFSTDNLLSTTDALIPGGNIYNESTTLTSENILITTGELLAGGVVTLNTDNTVTFTNNISTDNSITITSNNSLNIQGNVDANNSIQISSDGGINSITNIEVNSLADIEGSAEVDFILNLSLNAETSLLTDSGFNEESLADFTDTTIFLSEHGISVEGSQIVELALNLIAASQLETEGETEDFFKFVSLTIDNEILFDVFKEAYNEIELSSEAITTFEVLNVLNILLPLNINSEVLFQISSVIESAITISSNHLLSVSEELIPAGGTIYNEAILLLLNASIDFNEGVEKFLKVIGVLLIKNINTLKG